MAATQLRSEPVVEVAPRRRLRLRLGLPEHYVTTPHSSVAASFQKKLEFGLLINDVFSEKICAYYINRKKNMKTCEPCASQKSVSSLFFSSPSAKKIWPREI
jgi:hypothetical protein